MAQNGHDNNKYDDRFKLRYSSEFEKVPAIRWQIKGALPLGGISVLHGPPKTFKTYIALSMALSCAARQPWQGLEVRPATVLYIGAEGFFGLIRRHKAWEQSNTAGQVEIGYWKYPVNFFSGVVAVPIAALEAQGFRPDFIIVDTLQRASVGADENSVRDMGRVFDNMREFFDRLSDPVTKRPPTGLIVHHDTKAGDGTYRGSSTIFGDVDAMITSKLVEDRVVLSCDAIRDGEAFSPMTILFHKAVSIMTEDGWQTEIAVKANITPEERSELARLLKSSDTLDDLKKKGEVDFPTVLKALKDGPLNNGALEKMTELTPSRLSKALRGLQEAGHVEEVPELRKKGSERVYRRVANVGDGLVEIGFGSVLENSLRFGTGDKPPVPDQTNVGNTEPNRTEVNSNLGLLPETINGTNTPTYPQDMPPGLRGALNDGDRLAEGAAEPDTETASAP